jgi:hypothetical protein
MMRRKIVLHQGIFTVGWVFRYGCRLRDVEQGRDAGRWRQGPLRKACRIEGCIPMHRYFNQITGCRLIIPKLLRQT